jgi:hypothetical protein
MKKYGFESAPIHEGDLYLFRGHIGESIGPP